MPMRWRLLSAGALLLALCLLAWVAAHWGWRWFGPAPVPESVNLPQSEWARRIADARLFGAAAPNTAAAPSTLGDLRLLGVFAQRDGKGYALFRSSARGPMLIAAGSDVAPGVRLEAVRPTGVTLVETGVRREMTLRPAAGAEKPKAVVAAAASKPGCAPPAGFNGPIVRLNAELLSGMMNAPDSWKTLVQADAGGLIVRDQSGFAGMMSLRSGDRVEGANGIPLVIADDIGSAVLAPLTKSQPVWVSGTRDGKRQQWLYLNAGACPG
jgi:hypothetical protein